MPKIFRKIKKLVNSSMVTNENKGNAYWTLFSNINKFKSSSGRYALLKGIPIKDIIEYGSHLFPDAIKDDKLPNDIKNQLASHQKNTGIYLWVHGYDPEKCLGVGSSGVVWICKDNDDKKIAVKVTCDSKRFGIIKTNASEDEINDHNVLESILNYNQRASNYISIGKHDVESDKNIGKKRAVFTSEYADKGDLVHYKSSRKDYDRFIEIVDTGINVLQGLKILHDAGYSHNDVKPENLLAITNRPSAAVSQASTSSNGGQVIVKLADFGAMTKIDSSLLHQKIFANRYFCPPDMQNVRTKAVAKRDVYSLGAVLLYLFTGCPQNKAKEWARQLEKSYGKNGLENFCKSGKNVSNESIDWLTTYNRGGNSVRNSKILAFLDVVRQMVASSYSRRLSIETALRYMLIVKNMPN